MRLLYIALLFMFAGAAMGGEPLDIETVIDPSGTTMAALSPDTKHIAAIIFNGNTHGLVLIDTLTGKSKVLVQGRQVKMGFWGYHKAPRRVIWAGNDVLVVDFVLETESLDLAGNRLAKLGESLYAAAGPGADPGKVLINRDVALERMALCDARSGQCTRFNKPDGKVIRWAFDKTGWLRAVTTISSGFFDDTAIVSNWYRPAGQVTWDKLGDFKVTDDYWMPMYVPDEPDTIVVRSRTGRDTYALFNYDVKQRKTTEMLAGHPTQDLVSWDGIEQESFDYVVTEGMRTQQVWFDPAWSKAQQQVDGLLPQTINVISGDPAHAVLIRSYGDRDPGSWRFLNLDSKTMRVIGMVKPGLDTSKLLPVDIISYKASDGLAIPAYLTRPAGVQGPAPLVVLIHGGPIARDDWEFNAEVQLLASRGYLVFQPQFRGSTGFGRTFEEAGYRQWGRAMQDDITAGVAHLVKQGLADPQRVCIVGASYGGYAALWGLASTPQLYKCGVSFAGVSDIGFMFNDRSDSNGDKRARQVMQSRIGNRGEGPQLFDPVSPLLHAADIQAPVLLMHGEEDERVPIAHGKKMRDALLKNGKQVTWLSFPDEGHGLGLVSSDRLYYKTLLDFLGKYIGPESRPSAAGAAPLQP